MAAEQVAEDSTRNYIAHHPQQAASILRTMIAEESVSGRRGGEESQVAAFIVALGENIAGNVLRYMSDNEVEYIAKYVLAVKDVTKERSRQILEVVRQRMVAHDYVKTGGAEFARQMLAGSLGQKRADEILGRATGAMTSGFAFLKDTDSVTIWTVIQKEHPQTIAIILSQLEATQAAQVMALMPEERQSEVATRIATMERVDPETIRRLEENLKKTLAGQLSGKSAQSGGYEKAAQILNLAGRAVQKNVFKTLEARNPELVQQIKSRMFTFGDIATALDNRGIRRLLSEVDTKELAKALKACDPLLKEKILANMSSRGRDILMEEIQYMPPIRTGEVEEVQNRIVQIVNQLEEAGEITILRAGAGKQEQYV